jgi:hypothetical protein
VALRSTLNEVVEQVRNEARLSTNTSRGIDHLDHIKQLIKRHYYALAEDFDWQHLELKRDTGVSRKVLQAGSRYYDFPTAVNVLKITKAWVKWGSGWEGLEYGITYSDRSSFDPDANQRADPARKWMFYGHNQFEVWPLPSSNGVADGANEVAFEGQKAVETLTSDSSRLDMDDILVSLLVSAEILAENEQETAAKVKAGAANARMETLRGNLGSKTRYVMNGGTVGEGRRGFPRHPTFVR